MPVFVFLDSSGGREHIRYGCFPSETKRCMVFTLRILIQTSLVVPRSVGIFVNTLTVSHFDCQAKENLLIIVSGGDCFVVVFVFVLFTSNG